MFKIEPMAGEDGTSLMLIGRLSAEYLLELKAQIKTSGRCIALDLDEVTLVDVEAVRFLSDCEAQGIELRHCPPYIREWIARERERKA